jgi:hypothetical protein
MSKPPRTRIMLEINGQCSWGCKMCLPIAERTGVQIRLGRLQQLAEDWKNFGIEQITLAGFGSPVGHPDFADIVTLLASRFKFRVAVVCRPDDLGACWGADSVIVSVQSYKDACKLLSSHALGFKVKQSVSTHTLLLPELRDMPELDLMLTVLGRSPGISRVNFAHAVILSQDAEHVATITALNKDLKVTESVLDRALARMPDEVRAKVTVTGKDHFPTKCAFWHDLIYVDAGLSVRLCCHCPTSPSFGNLDSNTLAEVLHRKPFWGFEYEHYEPCQKCPNTGDASREHLRE